MPSVNREIRVIARLKFLGNDRYLVISPDAAGLSKFWPRIHQEKVRVFTTTYRQVCLGSIDLKTTEQSIVSSWTIVYDRATYSHPS
jgi:hypothetical protein